MSSPRKVIPTRVGDRITKFSVDGVMRFRAEGKVVMADLIDGRSMYMPKRSTVNLLAIEFAADFVPCAPGLIVRRSLLMSYTQASREEGGGGWLRVAGSGKAIRVTDSFRNAVAEAVVQCRIAIALAGPSDAKVTSEEAYAAGKQAHAACRAKSPPSGLDRVLRGWWIAGWNDSDIELESKA